MDDIFAIQMLKARYFRAIDTKDWDLLRSVVAEDVAVDVTDDVEGGSPYTGGEVFVSGCARILADAVTVHHGHTPEIEVTGPDTATGTWAMEDHVEFADGSGFRGAGHYHETYARVDGTWRIRSLTLRRLRRDPL